MKLAIFAQFWNSPATKCAFERTLSLFYWTTYIYSMERGYLEKEVLDLSDKPGHTKIPFLLVAHLGKRVQPLPNMILRLRQGRESTIGSADGDHANGITPS